MKITKLLEGIRQILWREVMSTPRIAEAPIAELKAWMEQNRTQLAARNINRIDGYYNDDDLDNWCVDDINAYHQTGSDFGEPTIDLTKDEISSITELMDALTGGTNFFQGEAGNSGDIRLLFGIHPTQPGLVIELAPRHLVSQDVDEEVELY
jgi:hypothetical protein